MAKRKVTQAVGTGIPEPVEVVTPPAIEEPAAAELPGPFAAAISVSLTEDPAAAELLVAEDDRQAITPEPAPAPPAPDDRQAITKEKAKKAHPPQAQPAPIPRPAPGDVVQVRLVGAPQAILLVADGRQITVLKGELHRARYAHYRLAWQANRTAWSVKYPGAAAFIVEAD